MSKNTFKTVCIVLSVLGLVCAFLIGAMGLVDGVGKVKQSDKDYSRFSKVLTTFSEGLTALDEGRAQYDRDKSVYELDKEKYDEDLAAFNEDETAYVESVMEYNQNLIAYSMGRSSLISGEAALNEGRAQIAEGWTAYNAGAAMLDEKYGQFLEGKQMYEMYQNSAAEFNKLIDVISVLESVGISHEQALAIISAQLGYELTDEQIAAVQLQLDSTKQMIEAAMEGVGSIEDAEALLEQSRAQLDQTYNMLVAGEAAMKDAAEQLEAGKAEISSIGSSIYGGKERLSDTAAEIEAARAALEERENALKEKESVLREYEALGEKTARARESLIDGGYGTDETDDETMIEAAQVHENELRGAKLRDLASYAVTYSSFMLSVLIAAAALIILKNRKLTAAKVTALTAVVLGFVSVIASLVFGRLETLALFSAVLAFCGISMAEPAEKA